MGLRLRLCLLLCRSSEVLNLLGNTCTVQTGATSTSRHETSRWRRCDSTASEHRAVCSACVHTWQRLVASIRVHACKHACVCVTIVASRLWLDVYPRGGGGIWLRSTGAPSSKPLITLRKRAAMTRFFLYPASLPAALALLLT